jgi:hypothetical protein
MIETIRELPCYYDIHDIAEKVNELVSVVNELSEQQSITWITGNDNCQIAVRNMPIDKMQKICAIIGDEDEEEE